MPSLSTTQVRINELSNIIHQYNSSYYCSTDTESSLFGCNDETYDLKEDVNIVGCDKRTHCKMTASGDNSGGSFNISNLLCDV